MSAILYGVLVLHYSLPAISTNTIFSGAKKCPTEKPLFT